MHILAKIQSEADPIHQQPQSHLFSLPYELRALVYEAVFAHNVIHLSTVNAQDREGIERVCHTWCIEHWDARMNYVHAACSEHPISAGHLLGLPLTCRRLYLESIRLLYAQHTFSMTDKHASTFWAFYRKTPMCHLNAVRSLRLLTTLVPPIRNSQPIVYKFIKSQYIGAWEAISGLPNLQSLLVTSNYAFLATKDEIMHNADFILPMKVVQQRELKRFDVVLNVSLAFFPRDMAAIIRQRKLLWECFAIATAGDGGASAGLWGGMHPACRLIAMNASMKNAAVSRQVLAERDLFAWIDQFGTAPSALQFNSADAKANARQLRLYERWWPEAQHTRQGSEQEAGKATMEAARNAVEEKYQHVRFACELHAADLREINRAVDLGSMDRAVRYLYKYPELPEKEEAPIGKYFIAA